jgi:hypothetical protein
VIDKSNRENGTFSREDFLFDKERNVYTCPAGKVLTTTGKLVNDGETLLYLVCISQAHAIAVTAYSRRSAVQRCLSAESREASMRKRGT